MIAYFELFKPFILCYRKKKSIIFTVPILKFRNWRNPVETDICTDLFLLVYEEIEQCLITELSQKKRFLCIMITYFDEISQEKKRNTIIFSEHLYCLSLKNPFCWFLRDQNFDYINRSSALTRSENIKG